MQNHAKNVFDSKIAAKQDLMTMLLPTLGATALYLIPLTLLSLAAVLYLGTDVETVLSHSAKEYLLCGIGFFLVYLFALKPIYFGLTQFYAVRRVGMHPSAMMPTMCLSSWALYWKSVAMTCSILVHCIAWAIPIGGIVLAVGALQQMLLPNQIGAFLVFEIGFLAGCWYLCMVLRYQCAYVLFIEKPKLTCWQCVREAADAFRGQKRALISLLGSFMLWFLLMFLLGDVVLLFLYPYLLLTLFHLFDRVRGVKIVVTTKPSEEE